MPELLINKARQEKLLFVDDLILRKPQKNVTGKISNYDSILTSKREKKRDKSDSLNPLVDNKIKKQQLWRNSKEE